MHQQCNILSNYTYIEDRYNNYFYMSQKIITPWTLNNTEIFNQMSRWGRNDPNRIMEKQSKKKMLIAQMPMMETRIHNEISLMESKSSTKNDIQIIKHVSMIALFYKHIVHSEINRLTSLKLAMRYVAYRVLQKMLDDGLVHESFVVPYLKDHPNTIDFSRYTCSSCNDIGLPSACDCH